MSHLDLVHRFVRALETGNRAVIESCLAPDFHHHDGSDGRSLDREQFITYALNLHAGIPDIRYHVDGLRADNPVRASRQVTGTHTDRLDLSPVRDLTLLATRERIRLPPERVTFTIRHGRITSQEIARTHGGGADGIVQQLGNARALTAHSGAQPLDAVA